MTPPELEEKLRQLGRAWPIPSVTDVVMARIESQLVPPPRRASWLRRHAVSLSATAALLALSVGAAWLFILATPATLQAQMQQSLEKARSAHIVISSLDENGVRQRGEIWYERSRGFRAESSDEVILDDGRQQWTWRPGPKEREIVIARRASRNAASMIASLFQFGDAPAAWDRQRAPEHDREIDGRPCRGFIVIPPVPQVVQGNGAALVPDPHPPRFVILIDPNERIVHLQQQRQVEGRWLAGREIAIAFDVQIAAEKLAVNLPAGGRVIDADCALEERFPLDKALARGEADGLLFAIHEMQRGPDEIFYVVSSVRGTPEYLKKHPPRRRRINLQVTLLEVARQLAASSSDQDCYRVVLASAEADGVHYLWWLAVRKRYFTVEQSKRKPYRDAPSLEVSPSKVRVPLQAVQDGSSNWVRVKVDVALAADQQSHSLVDLAARTRRDALLIGEAPGAVVHLVGWRKDAEHQTPAADKITDGDFANQISRELEWFHSHDEVHIPKQPGT